MKGMKGRGDGKGMSGEPSRTRLTAAVGLLTAITAASVLAGCGGGPSGSATAGSAACVSYPIHGAGKYRYEVRIQVAVTNATSAPASYAVAVNLAGAGQAGHGDVRVTVTGLVAAATTAQLSHKVLTVGDVKACRVIQVTRS